MFTATVLNFYLVLKKLNANTNMGHMCSVFWTYKNQESNVEKVRDTHLKI